MSPLRSSASSLSLVQSPRAFNLNVNPDLKFRGASPNDVPFNSPGPGKEREGEGDNPAQFNLKFWNVVVGGDCVQEGAAVFWSSRKTMSFCCSLRKCIETLWSDFLPNLPPPKTACLTTAAVVKVEMGPI